MSLRPALSVTFVLAGLLPLLGACRSTPDAHAPEDGSIAFRNVSRGYQSAVSDSGVTVARTPDEWRAMWNRHTASVVPRPELPAVDFGSEMVVCARLGTRTTSGYGIEIVRLATDADGALLVATRETKPAADAMLAQVVTQPFHMVATARRDGAVRPALR